MIKMIMMFAICYGFDYDDCDAHGDGDDGQDKTATRTKPHLDHHTQDMNGQNYGHPTASIELSALEAQKQVVPEPPDTIGAIIITYTILAGFLLIVIV